MRLVSSSLFLLLAACGAKEEESSPTDTAGVTDTADTSGGDTSAEDTATDDTSDTNDTVDTGADTADTGADTADSGSDTGADTSDTGTTDTSDTGPTDTSSRDVDGDGYTVAEGDCDDSNPAVNPGAREIPDNRVDEDCDGTVSVTPPPSYTFAADVLPILRSSCQSCHSGRGASGGLDMSDAAAFGNLVNVGSGQLRGMDRIEPGDSTRSYLALKIQNTHVAAGGTGTQMPPRSSLTRENVAIITSWIDGGAVER